VTFSFIGLALSLALAACGASPAPSPTAITGPERAAPAAAPAQTATPATETAATTAVPEPAANTAAPPAARGLEASTWKVAAGSKARFTVGEKLARLPLPNDAVVETTALTGTLRREGPSVVELDLQRLRSDSGNRDRYMRGTMFRLTPKATFTIPKTPEASEGLAGGTSAAGSVEGVLAIGARETAMALTGEARYDAGKLYLLARGSFTWEQLGIRAPNVAGIVEVQDTVHFEVLVVAEPA